jgi:hypothetical protein
MKASYNGKGTGIGSIMRPLSRLVVPVGAAALLAGNAYGATVLGSLAIVTQLNGIGALLGQIAPILSGSLFILAGVIYAIGQILPPDKKAAFHTTAVNIIIGAIVLAALSLASTGLATLSSHLLTNSTSNTIANAIT